MRVAIITTESADNAAILVALRAVDGIDIEEAGAEGFASVLRPAPRVVVLCVMSETELSTLPPEVKRLAQCPLLVVVPAPLTGVLGASSAIDDFAVAGAGGDELRARVRRLASTSPAGGEVLRRGDLMVDTVTCEVSLQGLLIELTFKEYELLKFLASHPGRVYSRESLLNSVWGYDYYGGDRTVDVHVRRLRAKIEDANHTFIDTVRNMGYRFRRDV
jgi:two-component system alkaline phosphatase synthesis response regulator PhoP